jgi:hypothetical protein
VTQRVTPRFRRSGNPSSGISNNHICAPLNRFLCFIYNAIFAGSSVEPQSTSRFTRAAHNPSPELARHRGRPRRGIIGFCSWAVKRFLHAIPRPNSVTQDLVHRIDLDGRTGSLPNGTILPIRSRPATPPAFPHARCRMATFGWCLRQGSGKMIPFVTYFWGSKQTEALPPGTGSLTHTCRRALRNNCPPRCAQSSHTPSSLWSRILWGLSWDVHPQAVQASIGTSRERQSLASLTDPGTFNILGRPTGAATPTVWACELVSGENLWPRLGTTATG